MSANLERFMEVYRRQLLAAVTQYPGEYAFGPQDVGKVSDRMKAAFIAGSYNTDGRAIKATCKELGIKHTRKAMEEFFGLAVRRST